MPRFPLILPLIALVLALPATVHGGPAGDEGPLRLDHAEHEEVRLVQLYAVVTNRRGKVIQGLEARDFRLYEDRRRQEIRYFGADSEEPVAIAFLLDLSGSMRRQGRLELAKESVEVILGGLGPADRFGLIGFADEQVTWITDFTADRATFLRRLAVQEAYGRTALLDALAATPRLVDERGDGRKAIILITDGVDNASQINTFSAVQLARGVPVPIHVVHFRPHGRRIRATLDRSPEQLLLERFAAETGGSYFAVHDRRDVERAARRIEREVSYQYVLGYYPRDRDWDGVFRRVRLETVEEGYRVLVRRGYYAGR